MAAPIFEGKVCIVTGAARGLGRDYARFFSEDGATVVVADIDVSGARETAESIVKKGGNALAVPVDVTDAASTEAMAAAAVHEFGRIDILVNNAGLFGDLKMTWLLDTDPNYWDVVMAVNAKGPFLCSRAVVPTMVDQGQGRLIHISSIGAWTPGTVYSVSKLAVHQISASLAAALGDLGITSNCVAPGAIWNEASQRQIDDDDSPVTVEQMESMRATFMIKRFGTSRDMYGAIRYLASDDAAWVTSQVISPNGGGTPRF
ncbi:MAG: SDR family oxidoreductase [Proteobacteria bacterium]|nr:SDR family oxidoreductase [Pseudomonadota bacterium]